MDTCAGTRSHFINVKGMNEWMERWTCIYKEEFIYGMYLGCLWKCKQGRFDRYCLEFGMWEQGWLPVNSTPVLWNNGNCGEWNLSSGHESFCPYGTLLLPSVWQATGSPILGMASSNTIPKNHHAKFFHSRMDFSCSYSAPVRASGHVHSHWKGDQQGSFSLWHSHQRASTLLSTAKHQTCFPSCETQVTGSRTAAHVLYFVVREKLAFEGNISACPSLAFLKVYSIHSSILGHWCPHRFGLCLIVNVLSLLRVCFIVTT